jgi:hypothetical protein
MQQVGVAQCRQALTSMTPAPGWLGWGLLAARASVALCIARQPLWIMCPQDVTCTPGSQSLSPYRQP